MTKNLLAVTCIFLFSCFFISPSHALTLSKAPHHYAQDMEFYYQKPNPGALSGLMRSFSSHGLLSHGEKRLLAAAFLAELAITRQLNLPAFIEENRNLGKDARITLAWSAHLAQLPEEDRILEKLLEKEDKAVQAQIKNSPTPLSSWNINQEKSVLQMCLGAFMASGNPIWLDTIINSALTYCQLNTRGRLHDTAYITGKAAAAMLYEYAPRHPLIVSRLKLHTPYRNQTEKEMIELILRHS